MEKETSFIYNLIYFYIAIWRKPAKPLAVPIPFMAVSPSTALTLTTSPVYSSTTAEQAPCLYSQFPCPAQTNLSLTRMAKSEPDGILVGYNGSLHTPVQHTLWVWVSCVGQISEVLHEKFQAPLNQNIFMLHHVVFLLVALFDSEGGIFWVRREID